MRIIVLIAFYFLSLVTKAQPGDLYHINTAFAAFKDPDTKLYGFKDRSNHILVAPAYTDAHFNTNENVWFVKKGKLSGLYSAEGVLILEPAYTFIELHTNPYDSFIVVSKDNRKFGLTHLDGTPWLSARYPKILDFRKDLLLVSKNNASDTMVIDTLLHTRLDAKKIHASIYGFVDNNPYINDSIYIQVIRNDRFAIFSAKGRQISDFIFIGLLRSNGNLIQGCINTNLRKCGIIDDNNKTIIPFIYSFAGVFDNGTIRADTEAGESFYFDATGAAITKKAFKEKNAAHPYWGND